MSAPLASLACAVNPATDEALPHPAFQSEAEMEALLREPPPESGRDFAEVLTEFGPLARTMAEQITGLRGWAKGRARFATSAPAESRLRRLAA